MNDDDITIKDAILTAKPIDSIWKKIGKFLKFAAIIVSFVVTFVVFVVLAIPVIIYGISGFVILAFCLAILAGLFWALLFMLRFLLPDFHLTFMSFFDVNGRLNDKDTTR